MNLLVLAGTTAPLSLMAQSPDLSELKTIATLTGSCSRLVMGGRDLTRGCNGQIINAAYESGRSSFTFVVSDLAVVTFSGQDSPARGDEASLTIDTVVFTLTGMGTPPNKITASGSCLYTNPYAGPAMVNCDARSAEGQFKAEFLSDGKEPSLEEF